ncbi:hypothetical protein [Ancylobacter defluvii]|uniref:DUF4148 domain-containing protein n=1 Tax=Ancylobacter defluvii TaxID=1282440 RepID=A0A9W6N9B4_9HYPH|nr:hypothetical protein [Ancylobacter defluvii]MBS7587628.1 hypothetical protein [Ancylobacter defluvii]GLK82438.1 hypothetical protein GCM10017653_05070 [Ancylobacter defluvii]
MRLYTTRALTALLLTAAALAPAHAEPRDPSDAEGYAEALRSAHQARRGELPASSKKTAAQPFRYTNTPSTVGVEPYIARTIERNARGDR